MWPVLCVRCVRYDICARVCDVLQGLPYLALSLSTLWDVRLHELDNDKAKK